MKLQILGRIDVLRNVITDITKPSYRRRVPINVGKRIPPPAHGYGPHLVKDRQATHLQHRQEPNQPKRADDGQPRFGILTQIPLGANSTAHNRSMTRNGVRQQAA